MQILNNQSIRKLMTSFSVWFFVDFAPLLLFSSLRCLPFLLLFGRFVAQPSREMKAQRLRAGSSETPTSKSLETQLSLKEFTTDELLDTARVLSCIVGVAEFLQSSLGLFFSSTVYARDSLFLRAFWFGNDCITLFVACPLMLWSLKSRHWLLLLSMLFCAFTNYAYYAIMAALNVLWPLVLVLFSLPLVASLCILHSGIDLIKVIRIPGSFARQSLAVFFGGLGFLILALWLGSGLSFLFLHFTLPLTPESYFCLVTSQDAAFSVPGLLISSILLWRNYRAGPIFGAVWSVSGAIYMCVLAAAGVSGYVFGVPRSLEPVPLFAMLSVGCSICSFLLLRPPHPPHHD